MTRTGSSAKPISVTLILFFGAMSVEPAPAGWRQIFAGAQVLYDKIIGCAEFCAVRAASRRKTGCAAVG